MGDVPDPDAIPDDASGKELAGFVAEDVLRYLGARLAALVAVVAIVAGLMSESASSALKGACVGAGAAGVLLVLCAGLFGWRRSRQWWVLVGVLVVCGGLLAAVFVGSRP